MNRLARESYHGVKLRSRRMGPRRHKKYLCDRVQKHSLYRRAQRGPVVNCWARTPAARSFDDAREVALVLSECPINAFFLWLGRR